MNPFERFYDTEIGVYISEKNTYSRKGVKTLLGTLKCDLQPYYGDTKSCVHGLEESKKYKLYSDIDEIVDVGRYVLFGGEWYMVKSLEKWSMGMTAVIELWSDADDV